MCKILMNSALGVAAFALLAFGFSAPSAAQAVGGSVGGSAAMPDSPATPPMGRVIPPSGATDCVKLGTGVKCKDKGAYGKLPGKHKIKPPGSYKTPPMGVVVPKDNSRRLVPKGEGYWTDERMKNAKPPSMGKVIEDEKKKKRKKRKKRKDRKKRGKTECVKTGIGEKCFKKKRR